MAAAGAAALRHRRAPPAAAERAGGARPSETSSSSAPSTICWSWCGFRRGRCSTPTRPSPTGWPRRHRGPREVGYVEYRLGDTERAAARSSTPRRPSSSTQAQRREVAASCSPTRHPRARGRDAAAARHAAGAWRPSGLLTSTRSGWPTSSSAGCEESRGALRVDWTSGYYSRATTVCCCCWPSRRPAAGRRLRPGGWWRRWTARCGTRDRVGGDPRLRRAGRGAAAGLPGRRRWRSAAAT